MSIFNLSSKKIGGIRFLKIGRFNVSLSISRQYVSFKASAKPVKPVRQLTLAECCAALRETQKGFR